MTFRLATCAGLAAALFAIIGCAAPSHRCQTNAFTNSDGPLAHGVVFNDCNRNGRRDAGERGLAHVRVSNGRDIVCTDHAGRYALPVDDDTILFVIKPRGWMTPLNAQNLPQFYYIHKPQGSPELKYGGVAPTGPLPESVDFALHPQHEPEQFDALLLGDSQPRSVAEVEYFTHDIIEPLQGTSAAFAISHGDIVFDDLTVFEPLNAAAARLGIPIYNVQGNHDEDYTATDDRFADDVFERYFGPSTYAFDWGPVHFIIVDDVLWHPKTAERDGYYTPGLREDQMAFVKNDLAQLPREQLVVLSMHIPIVEFTPEQKQELFAVLAQHPHTTSFSAHTHMHEHWFLGAADGWPGTTPHLHTALTTSCGSWWSGAPDEVGIPHTTMRDGAPNGWCVATFDQTHERVRYHAARRPADYQMNIYTPEEVPAAEAAATEVYVNVFAGSEKSVVEMRVAGGPWQRLERIEAVDPYYAALKAAEEGEQPPRGRKLPKAQKSGHLWHGLLGNVAPGAVQIDVRTTDVYGQADSASRVMRVVD